MTPKVFLLRLFVLHPLHLAVYFAFTELLPTTLLFYLLTSLYLVDGGSERCMSLLQARILVVGVGTAILSLVGSSELTESGQIQIMN